jgi:formamidopyrimidine-DNA glycosylase
VDHSVNCQPDPALRVPELPEVEVVRAGLEPAVTAARIDAVTVFEERSLRRHDGPSEDFIERLEGRSILAAVRRGKFLWLPLSASVSGAPALPVSPAFSPSTEALVVHLGMSGQVLLREVGRADDALLRIRMHITSPAHGPMRVDFVDQRIFGSMAIDRMLTTPDGHAAGFGSDAALIPSQVAHIARDPLDPAFSDRRFFEALAKRRTGIKRALLDQNLISGIGNIYADEALWAARVHYDQPTAALSRARARTLLAEVRLVLGRALAEGGTSFDAQYVNVNGASGYFSHSLSAYGRQGKSCPRCGRLIIRESFMNRGSHFCPFCQRIRLA